MKCFNQISLFFLLFAGCFSTMAQEQWNPRAGVIAPYPAVITTSSVSSGSINAIMDDDDNTSWQSEAPLPTGFFSRTDLNAFYALGTSSTICQTTAPAGTNLSAMTDGNLGNAVTIPKQGNQASVRFAFVSNLNFRSISMKAQSASPIMIYGYSSTGDSVSLGVYSPTDAYQVRRFTATTTNMSFRSFRFFSTSNMMIFDVGLLWRQPSEWVLFDLGVAQRIGWIDSKQFTPLGATSVKILAGNSPNSLTPIATLNPTAIPTITTYVNPSRLARYVKLEFLLTEQDWQKGSLFDFRIYDQLGPYGATPAAQTSAKTVRGTMGINGIWQWGNSECVPMASNNGSLLYGAVASSARNYHELSWDVTDPDITPNYTNMANGNGTQALWWLNWDTEYNQWKTNNMDVIATIQFSNLSHPMNVWDNPYQAAYNYGYAFAQHFGPTSGNGLVSCMEVGNEPWDYPAEFYSTVLRGMAAGAKAGDPAMIVMPCALQSAFPRAEQTYMKNYMGARITPNEATYLDGINVHHYSYMYNATGARISTYPENPISSMRAILNDIRFRNTNMPGKKLFVTEWGWDSSGGGDDCVHSECVSEQAQAYYAIRGALWFMRLGVDNLNWFFYANLNAPSSLYSRSGMTGSCANNFQKKKSYYAVQELLSLVGDKHFLGVVREDYFAYIYAFGEADGTVTHLIAWRPIAAEITGTAILQQNYAYLPTAAWRINGNSANGSPALVSTPNYSNGKIILNLSTAPTVIAVQPANGKYAAPISTTEQVESKFEVLNNNSRQVLLRYELPINATINTELVNLQGQVVRNLLSGNYEIGNFDVDFVLTDIPAGMYFIRTVINSSKDNTQMLSVTRKIIVQ